MGTTLSILTTVSLSINFAYAWDGTCFAEEKSADLAMARCPEIGDPIVCDKDDDCRWSLPKEVKVAKSQSKLQKSVTPVKAEGGRLKKDLPPIEAKTEKIGDFVYYTLLFKFMPGEYTDALSTLNYKSMQDDLQISASSYKALQDPTAKKSRGRKSSGKPSYKVLEPFEVSGIPGITKEEREDRKNPIRTALEYSRPFLDTQPFKRSLITLDTFTLNAVVAMGITGWCDMFGMNDDRYNIPHASKKGPNPGNMMLYNNGGKWVYVPIDQGFARYLTNPWFKWVDWRNPNIKKWLQEQGVPDKDIAKYKQLLYTDVWLSGSKEVRTREGNTWTRHYKEWLEDDDKARYFVEDNLLYFPPEVKTDESLKREIIGIIDIVWKVLGPRLCVESSKMVEELFTKDKGLGDEKAFLKPDPTNAWSITKKQWKMVRTAMNNQIKLCTEWSENIDKAATSSEAARSQEAEEFKQWWGIQQRMPERPLFIKGEKIKTPEIEDLTSKVEHRRDTRRASIATLKDTLAKFQEELAKESADGAEPDLALEVQYGDRFNQARDMDGYFGDYLLDGDGEIFGEDERGASQSSHRGIDYDYGYIADNHYRLVNRARAEYVGVSGMVLSLLCVFVICIGGLIVWCASSIGCFLLGFIGMERRKKQSQAHENDIEKQ